MMGAWGVSVFRSKSLPASACLGLDGTAATFRITASLAERIGRSGTMALWMLTVSLTAGVWTGGAAGSGGCSRMSAAAGTAGVTGAAGSVPSGTTCLGASGTTRDDGAGAASASFPGARSGCCRLSLVFLVSAGCSSSHRNSDWWALTTVPLPASLRSLPTGSFLGFMGLFPSICAMGEWLQN